MAIKSERESEVKDDPTIVVEKREMKELTRIAKSWDFTCTFCFRRFNSAQAMGGHQNAHRNERREEKRLFIRHPIGHRKQVFIRALKMELADAKVGDETFKALFAKKLGGHANGGLKLDLDLKL